MCLVLCASPILPELIIAQSWRNRSGEFCQVFVDTAVMLTEPIGFHSGSLLLNNTSQVEYPHDLGLRPKQEEVY